MHLLLFAFLNAKVLKTFGLKIYYVLNFIHKSTKSYLQ